MRELALQIELRRVTGQRGTTVGKRLLIPDSPARHPAEEASHPLRTWPRVRSAVGQARQPTSVAHQRLNRHIDLHAHFTQLDIYGKPDAADAWEEQGLRTQLPVVEDIINGTYKELPGHRLSAAVKRRSQAVVVITWAKGKPGGRTSWK